MDTGDRSFTVVESQRAKNARLRLTLSEGLVVVVPRGYDLRLVPKLVQDAEQWLVRAYRRLRSLPAGPAPAAAVALPTHLALPAIGEAWEVQYEPSPQDRIAVCARPGGQLLLTGPVRGKAACREALRRWLNARVHQELEPALRRLAAERGFAVNRVLVKAQRTRWASCSRARNVSLNIKLLFLPPQLVHYVLVHELCHTVHLNHSAAFWALVSDQQPGAPALKRELRNAWRLVPAWVDADHKRRRSRG